MKVARSGGGLQLQGKKHPFLKSLWDHKLLYLFLVPGLIWFFVFCYSPMYGVLIAFKDYDIAKGVFGSEWVGFKHFLDFFKDPVFPRLMRNTLVISLLKIVIGFPMPIILSLMLNEVRHKTYKRVTQTISYLPYFISWVVVLGIWKDLFSINEGSLINTLLMNLGIISEPIAFFGSTSTIIPMVIATDVWKSLGFSTILYLAAMSNVNPELYEAATIDGAGRFRRIWHITLSAIKPTILLLFILGMGGILNAGFDQLWIMDNPQVSEWIDVIDTYVARQGIFRARYELSTAVGLFKSIVGVILILATNLVVKITGEEGLL